MSELGVVQGEAPGMIDSTQREEALALAMTLARRLEELRPTRVDPEDVRLAHALALNIVDLLEPSRS